MWIVSTEKSWDVLSSLPCIFENAIAYFSSGYKSIARGTIEKFENM